MASIDNIIASPYASIDAAYSIFAQSGKLSTSHVGGPALENDNQCRGNAAWVRAVGAQFASTFASEENLARVPVIVSEALKTARIKPNTLVRYIGMVQDIFEPELYTTSFQVHGETKLQPGAFRDTLPGNTYSKEFDQRVTLYCVPIPGESAWARQLRGAAPADAMPVTAAAPVDSRKSKRPVDEEDLDGGSAGAGAPPAAIPPDLAFPLLQEAELPCLVRLYGDEAGLRVSDVVEFIGIYTADILDIPQPQPAAGAAAADTAAAAERQRRRRLDESGGATDAPADDDDMAADQHHNTPMGGMQLVSPEEEAAHNPPPFLAPRLQALAFRRLTPAFPAAQPAPVVSVQLPLPATPTTIADTPNPFAFRDATIKPDATEAERSRAVLAAASASRLAAVAATAGAPLSAVRSSIVDFIAALLGGDKLAAEYVLLTCLSSVTARRDLFVLGKLALNIQGLQDAAPSVPASPDARTAVPATPPRQGAPPAPQAPSSAGAAQAEAGKVHTPVLPLPSGASVAVRRLVAGLAKILPRTALLPLRIDNLNALQLNPVKDAETNRLASGILQLSAGTLLVLDETVMSTGTLNDRGVKNMHALQELVNNQQVTYQFPYMPTEFPVDVPILLTSTSKPLIKTDVSVPLSYDARERLRLQLPTAADEELPAVFVEAARAYLGAARGLHYSLPPAVSSSVEDDLVAARKADRSLTQDDLSRWLTLARLAALSFGESALTMERWAYVRALEEARVARTNAATQ